MLSPEPQPVSNTAASAAGTKNRGAYLTGCFTVPLLYGRHAELVAVLQSPTQTHGAPWFLFDYATGLSVSMRRQWRTHRPLGVGTQRRYRRCKADAKFAVAGIVPVPVLQRCSHVRILSHSR